MLSDCYNNNRGITSENVNEIRNILSMSPSERAARKAASELFAELSNGAEFCTVEQLERKMREIYKLDRRKTQNVEENAEQNLSLSSLEQRRSMYETNHLSEENLQSAASHYSNGNLPEVNRELAISVPHPQTLNHVALFQRFFLHPVMLLLLLYHRLIRFLSRTPNLSFIYKNKSLIIIAIYSIVSLETAIKFLPTFIYYMSLIVMVISSFKMLKSKHEFVDFRIWSGLFLRYGDDVDAQRSENLFIKNNLMPYICFFLAFTANLIGFQFITDQWLPFSEIATISFILTIVTLFTFMYTSTEVLTRLLIMFSFALFILAKYPYELDLEVINSWRFLDLKVPTLSTIVLGNAIEFCLSRSGVLLIFIGIIWVFLALRNKWQGVFQNLIPHAVTLAWLHILIITSQKATMLDLTRTALLLAGFAMFLPALGIVIVLAPVHAGIDWLSFTNSGKKMVAYFIGGLISYNGLRFIAKSERLRKYSTVFQVRISIFN